MPAAVTTVGRTAPVMVFTTGSITAIALLADLRPLDLTGRMGTKLRHYSVPIMFVSSASAVSK